MGQNTFEHYTVTLATTANIDTNAGHVTFTYPEPKRLQLQLQPTRTRVETRLRPDSSGEAQSAPCLFRYTKYVF